MSIIFKELFTQGVKCSYCLALVFNAIRSNVQSKAMNYTQSYYVYKTSTNPITIEDGSDMVCFYYM